MGYPTRPPAFGDAAAPIDAALGVDAGEASADDDGSEPLPDPATLPVLTKLAVDPGELSPAFATPLRAYALAVPLATETITLTPGAADGDAVTVNGVVVAAGDSWHSPMLALGRTVLVIVVSQADGSNQTYRLIVTRGWPQQAYLKASATHSGAQFGASVAISGDTLVVGANRDDPASINDGAAYVFVRNGDSWEQQAYLKASDPALTQDFGFSVAISGDTLVVGAPGESSGTTGVNSTPVAGTGTAGAAYVFVRNGDSWEQQAYLKASNTDAGDEFGSSVGISGDTVVVGARVEASSASGVNGAEADDSLIGSGAAYVFVRSSETWTQQAYLKASNPGWADFFGASVAISGETIVVGAYWEDSSATGVNGAQSDDAAGYMAGGANAFNAGAAYVFVRDAGTWSQQAYLKASNTDGSDRFGSSVAISEDTVVVGAHYEGSAATGVNGDQTDDTAAASGAVYVFVRSSETWTQQAYLKASNAEASDFFGVSVAISGDGLVVGASHESSAATGVAGNQSSNGAFGSGAGYVFARAGGLWTQQAYLKPSNTDPAFNYRFGISVAISGGTTVAGAYLESSNATGVDGNQADRSAGASGAGYVFAR